MKKLLSKKAAKTVAGVAIAALAILIIWNVFDVGTRMRLSGAIDDILAGQNVAQARETLREVAEETDGGRSHVLGKLKEAMQEETHSIQGKMALIDTFSFFKETRPQRRALQSDSVSSRRAAAWKFHGDKTEEATIRPIVIDWIKDESADRRNLAAMIVHKLKIKECVPVLLAAIGSVAETDDDLMFATQCLDALAGFKPAGFTERLMEIAQDERQHSMLRGKAFNVVVRMDDAPIEKLQTLMLTILKNPESNNLLRNKAASVLGRTKFGSADVWGVLEEVLLSKGGDGVVQRTCLYALGNTAPLDRIKNLLLDRRVYNHPYFGIRVDVATGLAALHVQEKIALEILCRYMEDDDKDDLDILVPQEGILSFWALTGMARGVAEQRLFQRLPKPIMGDKAVRDYLWRPAYFRPGVSKQMVEAVQRLTTKNLDEVNNSGKRGMARPKKIRRYKDLKAVARTSRERIDQLLAGIRERKMAKEEKKTNKVKDQGPQLPKEDKAGK